MDIVEKNIETERLILKPVTPKIITELFHTKSKEEIVSFFGVDEQGYERYKEMQEKGMETDRITVFVFLLINKTTGLPIGECGFHTLNVFHRRAELFYLLRKDEDKQQGFMKEALSAVLQFGFESLQLHRIQALVASENIPSIKLLENNGFFKEGTAREDYKVGEKNEDSDCYSLLRWEWEKQPSKEI